MSSDRIAGLIVGLKKGDDEAAHAVWERYFPDLVRVARYKLQDVRRTVEDEEDVAASALDSFCRAAQRGRFPDLADADGLWRLLSQMTARKAIDRIRRRNRRKEVGESALNGNESSGDGFPAVAGHDPEPEIAVMFADQVRHAMQRLQDPELKQVALVKLDGLSNEEIAARLGCSVRTVERRLRLIRKIWEQEFEL